MIFYEGFEESLGKRGQIVYKQLDEVLSLQSI